MSGEQPGFWDGEDRLRVLSGHSDAQEQQARSGDFELTCTRGEMVLGTREGGKGGRRAFDPVLDRMLVLQALHGLSVALTEYLVADRLSWIRFWRLGPGDAVPDANTLWDFREALIGAGAMEPLYIRFDEATSGAVYLPMAGQIVHAPLVRAARDRDIGEEKAQIKGSEKAAQIWPDKPAKACPQDADARWTVKFSKARPGADGKPQVDIAIPAFGYKSHDFIDRGHGVIRRAKTRDAAAHDGARLREGLIGPSNTASDVWADTAYH